MALLDMGNPSSFNVVQHPNALTFATFSWFRLLTVVGLAHNVGL